MSVFSMIKKGRQAAKEHSAKQAEKQAAESAKVPYRHVPRHAASDALSSGPASHREADRPKIIEQNRRRSMMTASGLGMSGTSTPIHHGPMFPRVNSALSHASYPVPNGRRLAQPMPRAYSYTSVQPGWSHHGGEVVYSPMEIVEGPGKGKEVEKIMVDSGRASRTSSRVSFGSYPVMTPGPVAPSPVPSSNNSASSQDDLEMKPVKHNSARPAVPSGPGSTSPSHLRPAGEERQLDYFHRLHPSKPRRISDPSSAKQYMSQSRTAHVPQKPTVPRNNSVPSASAGIPPVPALPTMHFGPSPLAHPAISSSGSSASIETSAAATTSSPTMVPNSTSRGSPRGSPPRLPIPEEVAGPILAHELDSILPEIGLATTTSSARPQASRRNSQRGSKTARFAELEPIQSNVSEATHGSVSPVSPVTKPEVRTAVYALPTQFDESVLAAPQAPVIPAQPSKSRGKLSKNPSTKLAKTELPPVKKYRWSLRSTKTPIAV